MDAKLCSFSSDCGYLWPSRYRSFRFSPKSSGKEICLLDRRPKGPGHRRFLNQLGGGGGDQLMYVFPPFSLIHRCLQKVIVIEDRAQVLLVAPVWRSRPWYPILLDLLTDQPCSLPINLLLVHLPWESLPHPLHSPPQRLSVQR